MEQKDVELLAKWLQENQNHKLNFLEKQAIKLAVNRADTVQDLIGTALSLLKSEK